MRQEGEDHALTYFVQGWLERSLGDRKCGESGANHE